MPINNNIIYKNFIFFINLLVSFIGNERFMSLKLLNIWNNSIKVQLNNIQLKDKTIINNIPDLNEIDNNIIKKAIIELPNDLIQKNENDNNINEFNNFILNKKKEQLKLKFENEYETIKKNDFNKNDNYIKDTFSYNNENIYNNSKIKNDNNNDLNNLDININKYKKNNEDEKDKNNSSITIIKSSLIINLDKIEDTKLNYYRNSLKNNYTLYEFIDENENESNYILNDGKIRYITIDLFIKKIAIENFSKNESFLVSAFTNQFCDFIDINIFINKIINSFHYYYKKNNGEALINLIIFLNNCVIEIYEYFKMIKFSNPLYLTLYKFYIDIVNKKKINLNNVEKILILFEKENVLEDDLRYLKELFHENRKENERKIHKFYSMNINQTKIKKNHKFSVLNFKNNEISNHLTYISKTYFYNINKKELLNSKFLSKNKEKDSPNIIKLINNSNNLTNFIKVNILSEKNISKKSKIIEEWIKICNLCKTINDFNDCFTIYLALDSYMISSLVKTWEKVDKNYISIFNEIKQFCSPIRNFQNLRERITNCNCPYLPFLGIYLKDFSNYDELFKYIKNDKLIDFKKINLIEKKLQEFFK